MYYKIIEKFGPASDAWASYLEARGLQLDCFDSIDGILRPDIFIPESVDDWENCVNDDYKINLIKSLPYAKKVLAQHKNASLVGVDIELDSNYVSGENLLGFDIIDGYCDVSLLTNWGADEEGLFVGHMQENGLIGKLDIVISLRDILREKHTDDSHAENCQVWAIYKINT
jgi:hypothetical protein